MAQSAFSKIDGTKQGDMSAGASSPESIGTLNNPDHKDEITVISSSFSTYVPIDPTSGQASGTRVFNPFQIIKHIDKSTPLLLQAAATGEQLKKVHVDYYRTSTSGQQEIYYTIELTEVAIVEINHHLPNTINTATIASPYVETVSFSFRNKTESHPIAGTDASQSYGKAS